MKNTNNFILTMTGPVEKNKLNREIFILTSDLGGETFCYQTLLYTNMKYHISAQNPYYFKNEMDIFLKANLSKLEYSEYTKANKNLDFFVKPKYSKNLTSKLNTMELPKQLHYYNLNDDKSGFFLIDYIHSYLKTDSLFEDFLNSDFSNFSNYFIWFTRFFLSFISLFNSTDKKKIKPLKFYTFNEIDELAQKYFVPISKQLSNIQKLYRDFTNYIYNFNNLEKLKNLTINQRFFVFYKSHETLLNKYSKNFSLNEYFNFQIIPGYKENDEDFLLELFNNKKADVTSFDRIITDNVFTLLYITLYRIVLCNKQSIKICKNCGKYFVSDKTNQLYCNNLFSNDKICKDIGNQIAQMKKQENEKIYGKYRKIYARKSMLVKRNPDIKSYKVDYDKWKKEASQFMNDIRNGLKTYEEFDKWLDKNK